MSRKLRFEDDNQTPKASDSTNNDTTAKPKRKQKFEHEKPPHDAASDTKSQTSAVPNVTDGAALAPLGAMPIGGESTGVDGGNINVAGLQQGTANLLRNISPDETPDRNTAVSATRFSLEVGATALSKMTANPNSKKKSKLQNKDSRLKFEQGDSKGDNGGNSEEPSQAVDNIEQSDTGEESANNLDVVEDGVSAESNRNDNSTEKPSNSGNEDATHKPSEDDSLDDNADTSEDTASRSAPNPKTKQSKADTDADTSTDSDSRNPSSSPPPPSSDKTTGKLQFTKDEKKVAKLEKKAGKYSKKLDKAQDKLPTKKVKKKQLVFDEKKGKTVSKLTHEKEKIPIGEAKWNKQKPKPLPSKAAGVVTSMSVTKIHAKVHQVEHENVGVKVAHNTELLGESAYRSGKQLSKSAYRFHKNRPYRRVARLERKSIKNKMKLDYRKALRDNPKLKSNPVSRFFQKRAIKRNYAKDLRNAKNAAKTGQKAVGITARAAKIVTAIVRKNPVFLIKAAILLLIVFLLLSLLTMCVGMFSGGTAFVGSVTYAADYEDICDASVLYTELETDLRIYINEIESNHPGYDEYRLNIDSIGHDPFALIAFLTAVYQDFTFAEVEATIRAIFEAQYTLELVSEMEIRTRIEERTGTGSWTDADGNVHTYTYTYTVVVEYEWHILNVTLTSRSFTEVLMEMMDDDQAQHFAVLMYSKGARQFVGNPFDFDWRPFVTSLYGYRIHPISGGRQFHWGLDIGLPEGTPLLAGLDGVVIAVGYQPTGYGNFVVIECADGNQVRYAHCYEVFITEGQIVERGDVIATVGTTGASTGPHLHIEVSRDGRRLNPIFFLEFR